MKIKNCLYYKTITISALLWVLSMNVMANKNIVDDYNISIFGDFRLRAEYDDSEKADGTKRYRERYRYRARIGVKFTPTDNWSGVIRMATNADGLNSPHEDFGSAQTDKKEFGIDQAYVAYSATNDLTLVGGKTPLPFWQSSESWWDKDINPEALAAVYKRGYFSISGAYAIVSEGSWNDDVDIFIYQGTYKTKFDSVSAKFGLGGAELDDSYSMFNAESFQMINAELRFSAFRLGLEYITSDADIEDSAYVFESRYKVNNDWSLRAYYFHTEAFAIIGDGTFGQDDFPNPGSTGVSNFKGYRLQLDYKVSKKVNIDLRYFSMERIVDANTLPPSASDAIFNEKERTRLQLNINMKF